MKEAYLVQEKGLSIVQKLRSKGHIAYFAGGWVRDHLLSIKSEDIDIATSATPDEVQLLFKTTIPVGKAFGVIIVLVGHTPFEVASFRKDGLYIYGRRPQSIEYATAEEDASRRDFTINGMFYDPIEQKVIDFVGGEEDLKKGIVRAIGDPMRRFDEDRLRMVRAVRIAARLGFEIDDPTKSAIRHHASELLPAVAMERIRTELTKICGGKGSSRAFSLLLDLRLLETIFPEFFSLPKREIKRRIRFFDHLPKKAPLLLYLLQLYDGVNPRLLQELAEKIRSPNKEIKTGLLYLRLQELLHNGDGDGEWLFFLAERDADQLIESYIRTLPSPLSCEMKEKLKGKQERLSFWVDRYRKGEPLVSSKELIEKGIQKGPSLGQLLREGWRISVERGITSTEELLQALQTSEGWPNGKS